MRSRTSLRQRARTRPDSVSPRYVTAQVSLEMPLEANELTQREQPAGDDVRADERLEHARRVGTGLARVVDAESDTRPANGIRRCGTEQRSSVASKSSRSR